jgi:hypothetical protein
MRETRTSGSEGGGVGLNHLSLPLYILSPLRGCGGRSPCDKLKTRYQ